MRQSFLLLLLLLNLTVSFSELTRAEQPATGLASESKSSPTFKTVKVHRHLQHTDKTAFRQGAPAKADEARMLISTPNLSKAESLLRVNQKNMAALKRDPTVIKQMQRLDNNPAIQAGIKNIRKIL